MSSHDGKTDRASTMPRAVVHKKILDAAESRPDASIEALAASVNGVSPDLVERVLDEYGDPAADDEPAETTVSEPSEDHTDMSKQKSNDATSDAGGQQTPEHAQQPGEVTEKQREILQVIQDHPEATQQDLAERFDISQATISNHLNSIDGFDWQHRREFVNSMFEKNTTEEDSPPSSGPGAETAPSDESGDDATPSEKPSDSGPPSGQAADDATPDTATGDEEPPDSGPDDDPQRSETVEDETVDPVPWNDLTDQMRELSAHVEQLEQRLDGDSATAQSPFGSPDLASRVVQACIKADNISEDEEIRIVKGVITSTSSSEYSE